MYGESNAGGALGITTKQAKFRNFGSVDVRTDSRSSIYSAIDINRKLSNTLALRAAAFYSDRELWFDRGYNDRRGAFLTGTYRPWKNSELRVDLEQTRGSSTTFRTYTDQTSNWDGTTTVSAALAGYVATDAAGAAIIDGSVGTGTAFDMVIDNTAIAAGQTVKLNSWKIRLPFK
jgi:hypothetical protein